MDGTTNPKWLLNPLDRAGEILFGLIMALTFTCSISIATHQTEVRQLLIGAIGCNLAWGIVDATMYLIAVLTQKSRSKMIINAIRDPLQIENAKSYIAEALPPVVASVIDNEGFDEIRNRLTKLPETTGNVKLTGQDIRKAAGLFLLMVISTLPVIIPFVFIRDTRLALRTSNLVAIVMMFLCGWSVAGYVGFNKWGMSIGMVLIGGMMVAITILLGG
ncbi:MAG TPA: VIT1/CCC1 transporter family protein [Chitinophagaceae bacterium]